MEGLKDIIREIKSYDFIKADDNTILEVSAKIFISQNISRDKKSEFKPKQDEPMTSKQFGMLKRLGINPPKNTSKKEAIYLIKSAMEKQEGQNINESNNEDAW